MKRTKTLTDRMLVPVFTNKASRDLPKKDKSGVTSALNATSAFNICGHFRSPCKVIYCCRLLCKSSVFCDTGVLSVRRRWPYGAAFSCRGICYRLLFKVCFQPPVLSLPPSLLLTCVKLRSDLQYKLQHQLLSLQIEYA